MIDTLTTNQAADMIHAVYDGSSFTYTGAYALAEYIEEMEDDGVGTIEMDPIALSCEYGEHLGLLEWADDYGLSFDALGLCWADYDDAGTITDAIREHLQDNTTLIEFDGGIIVQGF